MLAPPFTFYGPLPNFRFFLAFSFFYLCPYNGHDHEAVQSQLSRGLVRLTCTDPYPERQAFYSLLSRRYVTMSALGLRILYFTHMPFRYTCGVLHGTHVQCSVHTHTAMDDCFMLLSRHPFLCFHFVLRFACV